MKTATEWLIGYVGSKYGPQAGVGWNRKVIELEYPKGEIALIHKSAFRGHGALSTGLIRTYLMKRPEPEPGAITPTIVNYPEKSTAEWFHMANLGAGSGTPNKDCDIEYHQPPFIFPHKKLTWLSYWTAADVLNWLSCEIFYTHAKLGTKDLLSSIARYHRYPAMGE